MRNIIICIILTLLPGGYMPLAGSDSPVLPADDNYSLYVELNLEGEVSYNAFVQAMTGYDHVRQRRGDVLTLIDFSKPSTRERLYVLDIANRKMLYRSLVSHGRGSGENYATSFSNVSGSHKSSLGFYLTGGTYHGGNGYSLLLDGLEKGINDKARERAIVIHGADYCDPSVIRTAGRLGRSFGCPALPRAVARQVIDTIKDGTLLFIYADDEQYLAQSSVLNAGGSML